MSADEASSWERQKQERLAAGWLDPQSFSEFDDGSRLVGQRVFVAGHGEGVVRAFKKQMTGASPHEIVFHGAVQKEVKLRRKGNSESPWLLGPHIYASLATEWGDDAAWITVEVTIPGGNSILLRAHELDTVESLKAQIEAKRQILVSSQRLLLSGAVPGEEERVDDDKRTLASYSIRDGAVLTLILHDPRSPTEIGEPEPEPVSAVSAEAQEVFQKNAQTAWYPSLSEGNTDVMWVDGASLDDTPRHMLVGATVLVELPPHLLAELQQYKGQADHETNPRASPSAKGVVVKFSKRRLHDSVHCVDFTLGGIKKHPLGKQDLVLQCAGHAATGCRFLLLRSSWDGLLKDEIHARGREQRLCVVYENQRSQLSLGGTEVLAKLGMGVGRPPNEDDFASVHLIGHLDRPQWSSVDGKLSSDPRGPAPPVPPPGFRWDDGEWKCRQKWEYANGWNDDWATEITDKATVRRMRWERMLICKDPVAIVVENQRRIRQGGRDRWSVSALRGKDDCPPWCTTGLIASPAKPHILPNEGFQWDGPWELAQIGAREVDEAGWSYSKEFGDRWETLADQSQVRQRSWRRKMVPITRVSHNIDAGGTADLLVRVHRAEALPSSSPSSCNTYAVVSLGPSMTCKTAVVSGTASPTWNQLVRFPIPVQVWQLLVEGLGTLHCRILEQRMAADEVLGEVRINLVELLASHAAIDAPNLPSVTPFTMMKKNRAKVHLSHGAYQEHVGCESSPTVGSTAQLPAMFLDESWYQLHPDTTHASTESWNQGMLQVGIGLQHPGISASSGCALLRTCEEMQHLCEKISRDHSEGARARLQNEFQLYNGSYEIPWVARPHWFENRTRWECEQEHALLRWVALIKQKEKAGSSIHDGAQHSNRVNFAPVSESSTAQLPIALIGSEYFPAKQLQPDVLALVRQGMPGEDVWQRNRHIEQEEGLPSRVLQTVRSKMWYLLTGGQDLNQVSAGGYLELNKERVDKVMRSEAKTDGESRLLSSSATEDGSVLVRGYAAMALCDDMEEWLGLGEKRGGFKAGEACSEQIEKDIPRTDVTITPAESVALRRMLLTFARRYPTVGYCQGMHNIALAVLRTTGVTNEAQGFWTFAGLCQRVCPGYYSESMTGVQVDAAVVESLTKMLHDERSPRVNVIDHMQNLGYPVVMKVTQWLVNLFVNAIPMPMQQALWDWLIVDGTCALICFATTLIIHLSEEILKCTDFQQCSEVLQSAVVPFSTNAYIECVRVGPHLLRVGQKLYETTGVEKLQAMRRSAIDEIVGRNKERTRNMMVRKLTASTCVSKETVVRLHEAFDLARKRSPDLRTTMVAGHQTPWEERVIDYKAFVFMMEREMPELAKSDEMLQSLFNAFDDDRSGFVDEQEFIVGLSTLISDDSDSVDEKLRLCFSTADSSNDGRVGVDELQKLLESCYKLARDRAVPDKGSAGLSELNRQLSTKIQQEVTELFLSIGDETTLREGLTFEQFRTFVHSKPVILECFAAASPSTEDEQVEAAQEQVEQLQGRIARKVASLALLQSEGQPVALIEAELMDLQQQLHILQRSVEPEPESVEAEPNIVDTAGEEQEEEELETGAAAAQPASSSE